LTKDRGDIVRATVTGVVAGLRRGRRPYDRPSLIALAEELKPDPSRESQNEFIYRVRVTLEDQGKEVPGKTVLWEVCGQIYKGEHAKIAQK
jgi:hypothetical protein